MIVKFPPTLNSVAKYNKLCIKTYIPYFSAPKFFKNMGKETIMNKRLIPDSEMVNKDFAKDADDLSFFIFSLIKLFVLYTIHTF